LPNGQRREWRVGAWWDFSGWGGKRFARGANAHLIDDEAVAKMGTRICHWVRSESLTPVISSALPVKGHALHPAAVRWDLWRLQ
jgi:hypothetical protein